MELRKRVVIKETVERDALGEPCAPILRVVVGAVVRNPAAGRRVADLSALFDIGAALGERLFGEAVALLGGPAVSYGKGATVGLAGDMEHGGAMIHPKLGRPMRAALGGGKALIPSNVKLAGPGTPLDLPLGHKDDPWSFDHFDTITVMIADAPLPEEIVVWMGVADGGRPNPRCGTGPVRD